MLDPAIGRLDQVFALARALPGAVRLGELACHGCSGGFALSVDSRSLPAFSAKGDIVVNRSRFQSLQIGIEGGGTAAAPEVLRQDDPAHQVAFPDYERWP